MDTIVSLAKRRGFVFPSSEIYGGFASTWDYGPLGVELKRNIKNLWWRDMVQLRDDIVGLDSAILMSPLIWQASGHITEFTDPMVDCKSCRHRFRPDQIEGDRCPDCGGELTEARQFNLMFKTYVGPVEDDASIAYLRPETAQGIFVNFFSVQQSMRRKLPFGIAQRGKSFRTTTLHAHVWGMHHRYPTNSPAIDAEGRGNPAGAHPFKAYNVLLMHNGEQVAVDSTAPFLGEFGYVHTDPSMASLLR